MWTEELLKKFLDSDLGTFKEGIPKLLDLLEDPTKIPLSCSGQQILYPAFESDELTVRNFRYGLKRVLDEYRDSTEIMERGYLRCSCIFNPSSDGFLSLSVGLSAGYGYGAPNYTLDFYRDKGDRRRYIAECGKNMPKFVRIMERALSPNNGQIASLENRPEDA